MSYNLDSVGPGGLFVLLTARVAGSDDDWPLLVGPFKTPADADRFRDERALDYAASALGAHPTDLTTEVVVPVHPAGT